MPRPRPRPKRASRRWRSCSSVGPSESTRCPAWPSRSFSSFLTFSTGSFTRSSAARTSTSSSGELRRRTRRRTAQRGEDREKETERWLRYEIRCPFFHRAFSPLPLPSPSFSWGKSLSLWRSLTTAPPDAYRHDFKYLLLLYFSFNLLSYPETWPVPVSFQLLNNLDRCNSNAVKCMIYECGNIFKKWKVQLLQASQQKLCGSNQTEQARLVKEMLCFDFSFLCDDRYNAMWRWGVREQCNILIYIIITGKK